MPNVSFSRWEQQELEPSIMVNLGKATCSPFITTLLPVELLQGYSHP